MLKSVSSITNAIGALNYKGTWNATTNTPTIVSSVGTKGDYYVVSVAGNTTINGISNWGVGDWIVFNGSTWQRVEGGADLNGVNISFTGTSSGPTYETSNAAAGLTIQNNDITADGTDTNIDIDITPKGTGEVNIPKVDIDAGAIDGAVIGANSAAAGSFTSVVATSVSNGLGAVGTPSYFFTGDPNTGIWSPTSDTIAVSTNGAERMRFFSSGAASYGTTTEYGTFNLSGTRALNSGRVNEGVAEKVIASGGTGVLLFSFSGNTGSALVYIDVVSTIDGFSNDPGNYGGAGYVFRAARLLTDDVALSAITTIHSTNTTAITVANVAGAANNFNVTVPNSTGQPRYYTIYYRIITSRRTCTFVSIT